MRPSEAEITSKRAPAWDDSIDDLLDLRKTLGKKWKEYLDYNDSVLVLAATSTRLCNVFLIEHSKKYGLQNTLCRSIEQGDVNLVRRTVEYGADINKENFNLDGIITPLQLAVRTKQLPMILYLLRRGVDKASGLVMELLRDNDYHTRSNEEQSDMPWEWPNLENHCLCNLLHDLMDATLGSSQSSPTNPCLPPEVQDRLAPNGVHLWFILRTCMRREWGCDCGENESGGCPMRLISLLQRYGANWTLCGAYETIPHTYTSWHSLYTSWPEWRFSNSTYYCVSGRGAVDLARLQPQLFARYHMLRDDRGPVLLKPSVSAAMDEVLLKNRAYRQDHCLPFLAAILAQGVAAQEGDLAHAMGLASRSADHRLSIAIVVALLQAGTDANEPGVMKTAMRLACMEATKDAAVAFVTLLLEHGADPSSEEMQDEIQDAVDKWWIQSTWKSSVVFHSILRLLAENGLAEHVVWETLAVLGMDHDLLAAEEVGGSNWE